MQSESRSTSRCCKYERKAPWLGQMVAIIMVNLDGGFRIQMFGHLVKHSAVHSGKNVVNATNYVRQGERDVFD